MLDWHNYACLNTKYISRGFSDNLDSYPDSLVILLILIAPYQNRTGMKWRHSPVLRDSLLIQAGILRYRHMYFKILLLQPALYSFSEISFLLFLRFRSNNSVLISTFRYLIILLSVWKSYSWPMFLENLWNVSSSISRIIMQHIFELFYKQSQIGGVLLKFYTDNICARNLEINVSFNHLTGPFYHDVNAA